MVVMAARVTKLLGLKLPSSGVDKVTQEKVAKVEGGGNFVLVGEGEGVGGQLIHQGLQLHGPHQVHTDVFPGHGLLQIGSPGAVGAGDMKLKRFGALGLSLALTLSLTAIPAQAAEFSDVPSDFWGHADIVIWERASSSATERTPVSTARDISLAAQTFILLEVGSTSVICSSRSAAILFWVVGSTPVARAQKSRVSAADIRLQRKTRL